MDARVEEAKAQAPRTYEFYRGYLKGVCDVLADSNMEDSHPGLNEVLDHVVASIICDALREHQEPGKTRQKLG